MNRQAIHVPTKQASKAINIEAPMGSNPSNDASM